MNLNDTQTGLLLLATFLAWPFCKYVLSHFILWLFEVVTDFVWKYAFSHNFRCEMVTLMGIPGHKDEREYFKEQMRSIWHSERATKDLEKLILEHDKRLIKLESIEKSLRDRGQWPPEMGNEK